MLLAASVAVACGCSREAPQFRVRPGAKPTCSFELRRAEPAAAEGLVPRTVKGSRATYYLYPEVELSNADLLGASVRAADQYEDPSEGPGLCLFFTKAGARKLSELTEECGIEDREFILACKLPPPALYLAVLIDGELIMAPRVLVHLTGGVIPFQAGFAGEAEAEKTARALVGENLGEP